MTDGDCQETAGEPPVSPSLASLAKNDPGLGEWKQDLKKKPRRRLDGRRARIVCLLGFLALMPLLTYGRDWSYNMHAEAGGGSGVSVTTADSVLSMYFHFWFGAPLNERGHSTGIVVSALSGYFLLGLLFALSRNAVVRGLVGFVMVPASAWFVLVSGSTLISFVLGTQSSLWVWLFFLSAVSWIVIPLTHLAWFFARLGRGGRRSV